MKEDWTEQLRRKLENYEVEPPPGLWEDICKQMDKPFGLKPFSRLTGTAQRWWAVAAAVVALVGCFVVYEMSDSEQPIEADAVPQQQQEDNVRPRQLSLISRSSSFCSNQGLNQGNRSMIQAMPQNQATFTTDTVCRQENAEDELEHQDYQIEEHQDHQADRPMILPSTQYQTIDSPDSHVSTTKHSSGSGQWSIGLKASGGLLAANSTMQSDRLYQTQSMVYGPYKYEGVYAQTYSNEKTNASTSYKVTDYAAKHHLPLRFGLSLHYQLSPRLALLSGISYTRLSSEFSFPLYQNISYSQKLHYIGIPFGVVWQLWGANRFRIYLSGGAMVEKCVSVDLDGDYAGKKPWQWSLNAAAGAEFALTSLFGIYLEPSLGYYFSDGTQLDHYYKEHPLAPSIEFGLRMHLGR